MRRSIHKNKEHENDVNPNNIEPNLNFINFSLATYRSIVFLLSSLFLLLLTTLSGLIAFGLQ